MMLNLNTIIYCSIFLKILKFDKRLGVILDGYTNRIEDISYTFFTQPYLYEWNVIITHQGTIE